MGTIVITAKSKRAEPLKQFSNLNAPQLRSLLVEHLTKQKLGLYWESNAIERDDSLNANVLLPRLVSEFSHTQEGTHYHQNLIIEGENFDNCACCVPLMPPRSFARAANWTGGGRSHIALDKGTKFGKFAHWAEG